MTVLNIGGTGFIGASLTQRLVDAGEDVVCFDRDTTHEFGRSVEVVQGDITDYDSVRSVIETFEPTRIVNFAYVLGEMSDERPDVAARVNCVGIDNVFRAAVEASIERVIFASSIAVYGTAGGIAEPIEEGATSPAAYTQYPFRFYTATKQLNEYQAKMYDDQSQTDFVAVRPSIVFGHGRSTGSSLWASSFISDPARDKTGHIPFAADQNLNMVYRDDVAELFALIALAEDIEEAAYNTGGHEISAGNLVQMIERITDGTVKTADQASKIELVSDLSNVAASNEFEYQLTSLETGIESHVKEARAAA